MGVEPTASLVLSESGRPVAYRARCACRVVKGRAVSSGGRIRTHTHWFKASEPTVSRPRNVCLSRLAATRRGALRCSAPLRVAATQVQNRRKERELNPQGISARPFSRRLPSPVGLPFRKEQFTVRTTSAFAQGGRLNNGRVTTDQRSLDGWIRTSVLRLPKPADFAALPHPDFRVGPEGLEPSPPWLRARHAAANTWIPLGVSRAGGSRTHTLPLKRRIRCHYATAPKRRGANVSSGRGGSWFLPQGNKKGQVR